MSAIHQATTGFGMKTLLVELLYLDAETCAPCIGTEKALARAEMILSEPLHYLGVRLDIRKIHVVDAKIAAAEKFLSSPTIRVEGIDIDPARTEGDCPSCGALTGDAVSINCRNWHWRGEVFLTAPVGKIVESVLSATLQMQAGDRGGQAEPIQQSHYTMPQNLVSFFKARDENLKLSC